MTDHIGKPDGMTCPHCGLPFSKRQSEIDCYSCGSSYAETFKPQWARSMTCLEIENGQLQERIRRLEEIGDEMRAWCNDKKSCEQWDKIKQDKYE